MKFPYTGYYIDVKHLVFTTYKEKGLTTQRVGQALANSFELPKELEDKVWEDDDVSSVAVKVYDWFHRPDYQNQM